MHMRVQQRLSPALPRVLALLVVAVLINYIDRSNLSIAAPLLKDEFRLSASQLGILLSSFFWTYTLFQIVSGWAVDRFDVNWVIAAGFLTWSLATAATALVHGFILLLMIRLILGIGESAACFWQPDLAPPWPSHLAPPMSYESFFLQTYGSLNSAIRVQPGGSAEGGTAFESLPRHQQCRS
jgi:MFS family permease